MGKCESKESQFNYVSEPECKQFMVNQDSNKYELIMNSQEQDKIIDTNDFFRQQMAVTNNNYWEAMSATMK